MSAKIRSFIVIFAFFLLLLPTAYSKTANILPHPAEIPQQITFSSVENGIPIQRITVVAEKLLFDAAGYLIISDNTPVDLHIDYPAYPWEHSGTIKEYHDHIWCRFDTACTSAFEKGYTLSGLFIYDTSFYLVFEGQEGQIIYSAGEADNLKSVPTAEFLNMVLKKASDTQNSGGGL